MALGLWAGKMGRPSGAAISGCRVTGSRDQTRLAKFGASPRRLGLLSSPGCPRLNEMPKELTSAPPAVVRRHYSRPPVQEVVVSIQVKSERAGTEILRALHSGEEEEYPIRDSLMTSALRVDPESSQIVQAEQALDGYRLFSNERTQAVHFRRAQFAFSRLAPYDAWEAWSNEARRLWLRYRDATGVTQVTALGVRYVNRIDIKPEPGRRIRDYLRFYPQVPEEFPQAISAFVMRTEMKLPDLPDTMLSVNAGRVEPPIAGIYSVLLDIELRMTRLLTNEQDIWGAVEQLHSAENHFFESCITDLSRESFDQ